ncbi:MAG TPA: PilN domain-containing protein [Gemmatimonadales bacterium]
MININLKPGARRQSAKGSAFAGFGEKLRGLGSRIKEPGPAVAIGAWVLVAGVIGAMYLHTSSRLHALEPEMQKTHDEYQRYQTFTAEKRKEEGVRDSILAQIGTISSVDQARYTWSHILDEISGAMPEFTWLTSVSQVSVPADTLGNAPVTVLIAGQTSDLQNYTAFLRRLGDSHWLTNVVPVKTETVIDRSNRPLTAFTVQATFTRADSTQVQTVPILESTVR